jgi:hypothetical protein
MLARRGSLREAATVAPQLMALDERTGPDPDDVGAPADLAVEALKWVGALSLRQWSAGKA